MNYKSFEDRAMDVDPDIRFMALEDLKKYLNSDTNSKANLNSLLESIIPILLNMLNDQNPEVQNQAIKSFEPMVRYLKHETLLKLIKKLFTLVLQSTQEKDSNFTISIPNMALRSLFAQSNSRNQSEFVSDKLSTSNYKFDKKFARLILDYLLPQFYENKINIDLIELLIDILNEIGYALNSTELIQLASYLIDIAFTKAGIIGKKSIVALEKIVSLVNEPLIGKINQAFDKSALENRQFIQFQLYSVILRNNLPFDSTIYAKIHQLLMTESVSNEEDLDFDTLFNENALKDEAFTCLIDLVSILETLELEIINIAKAYLKYNPFGQEDEELEDEEDDIQFSDDEEVEINDENNDGSWKLRAKAVTLLKVILEKFPGTLETISNLLKQFQFSDSNFQVVCESLKTTISIVNSTSPRDAGVIQSIYPIIEQRITLITEEQLPPFLKLIESLNRFDNLPLISTMFKVIEVKNFQTSSRLEFLQFYSSILKYHDDLSFEINKISKDLSKNLDDKSFNIIIETIKCLNLLFHYKPANLQELIEKLVSIVIESKKYPSDLVRMAIISLSQGSKLLDDNNSILNAFKTSILYEGTNKVTVEVLIDMNLPQDYSLSILENVQSFILSSNEATSKSSLILANKIIQALPSSNYEIIKNLYQLLSVTNQTNYKYIFEIFNHLATFIDQKVFFQIAVKLLNESKIDENDTSFFDLIKTFCKINPGLFTELSPKLHPNAINAKTLSICCIENNLQDEIEKARQDFNHYKNNINDKDFAYNILFLGYIGSEIEIKELDIYLLISLLKDPKFANDSNIQATSTALGLISRKHMESSNIILNEYKSNKDTAIRGALVNALIIASDSFNEEQKKYVWDIVFNLDLQFDQSVISELRKSGELLGKIVTSFEDLKKTNDLKNIYLILIITKSLLNQDSSDELLVKLIKFSIDWLDIVNIDIRQIIVGNLLTALHQKQSIISVNLNRILPKIFNNLKAEDEFKKIITMGPYKYVLDQGLEVRKLCYEFIYSIISLDDQPNIDIIAIAKNIIEFGLIDTESDITVLSCINLINFIEIHKDKASQFFNDESVIAVLINHLKIQLNKKLSAKASTQDTDAYQERIKSIIKLSKKVNYLVEDRREWAEFYNWLREDFTVYFKSIE